MVDIHQIFLLILWLVFSTMLTYSRTNGGSDLLVE